MRISISFIMSFQTFLFDIRILCAIFCMPSLLYTQDYTGRLPSSITLPNGANESVNLIATCGNQYCYAGLPGAFINNAYDFSYSTSSGTSHLSVHAITPPNTINQTLSIFYAGELSVGSNSHLKLNDFHTTAFQRGLKLGANSSLEITLQKGHKISASEFGASSKLYLATSASLYLEGGASFHATNMDFFNLNSQAFIDKNATMRVEADAIRLHNTTHNYGTLNLVGEVWNVGASANGIYLATSIFSNTEGKITIQGDFYNGGKPKNDGGFDFTSPGGGSLINRGGDIYITGKLINQKGEEYSRVEYSSVEIYGGSLKVNGGMTNAADSTLVFGAYNGEFGELIGNVDNQGSIKVDVSGATLGKHTLIQGTLSGKQTIELLSQGGKNEFISFTQQSGTTIDIEKNTQAIASFTQRLSQNEQSIINAFEENFSKLSPSSPQSLYTFGGSAFLTSLSGDINSSVRTLSTQAPSLSLWSMVQNTTLPLIYQPTKQDSSFSIAPFMSNATSTHLSAPLYGASLSASTQLGEHLVSVFATYATSQSTNALSSTRTSLESRAFLIGLYDVLPIQTLELTLLAYYGSSQHTSKREVFFDTSSLEGAFSYNELGLQTTLGYPLAFQRFSMKPFAGLHYTLGMQGAMAESSHQNVPALSFQARQDHILALLLGTQMQYHFSANHILFAGVNLQYALTPAQQVTTYFGTSPLYFKPSNTLGYALHIGGSMPLSEHISLSVYALYAHSYTEFNTYSGIFNLSYHF